MKEGLRILFEGAEPCKAVALSKYNAVTEYPLKPLREWSRATYNTPGWIFSDSLMWSVSVMEEFVTFKLNIAKITENVYAGINQT